MSKIISDESFDWKFCVLATFGFFQHMLVGNSACFGESLGVCCKDSCAYRKCHPCVHQEIIFHNSGALGYFLC